MTDGPTTLPQYMEAVTGFARKALGEFHQRYASGERGFAIEEHIDRAKVRTDFFGRYIDPKWFQDLFYRIVVPEVEYIGEASVYADFLIIPDPFDGMDGIVIPEHNIMVYRLSVE